MKATYRGYSLEAKRERSAGGWSNLYFSAVRQRDGFIFSDGVHFGNETPAAYLQILRFRIAEHLIQHPDLLPCPYCGGTADLDPDTDPTKAWMYRCTNLDCRGVHRYSLVSLQDAADIWNSRHWRKRIERRKSK